MAQRTSSRRPLIGVTAGASRMMSGAWAGHDAVTVTGHYVEAIRAAGGRPVIIAAQDEWTDDEVAELDAVVLTGGTDLDPARFGQDPLATDMAPDSARDAFETALYHSARRVGLPVLGICRGLQIIVIAEGGALHRHLPLDVPAHPATGLAPTRVEAQVEIDSDLAMALGTSTEVTAYHHQGVKDVAGQLRVVARHDSGLPLAVEASCGAPVLAVQWHPELDTDQAGIFESLITAVRHRKAVPDQAAAGLG